MMFDPQYLFMVMLPGLILGGIATMITKSTFSKYSRVGSSSGFTGAEAAQTLLDCKGIHDVRIEAAQGFLSDHYDPTSKTLRLSPDVYGSQSLSAIGVACHEAGHAIQHFERYTPLKIRTALVPVAQFGTQAAYLFILVGFFLQPFLVIGALLFIGAVLFSLVTLPVEWDASARAKKLMVHAGIVNNREMQHAGAVLNAAFLTYVAAAVTALLTLLYYLIRSGLLGGRR